MDIATHPALLDFARLLEPIPGENAAGEDLRSDSSPRSLYYRIKGARNEARTLERRRDFGDADGQAAAPLWQTVRQLVPQVLAERSKDLELVAYLIEALAREEGFPGITDGFRLARELSERFWDSLYPRPDEDGVAIRVAHLAGLNGTEAEGTLIRPILAIPITQANSVISCSTADYHQAKQLEELSPQEQRNRIDDNTITLKIFETAVRETPRQFFRQLRAGISRCLVEWNQLHEVLSALCGDAAPHSSNIRKALESVLETITYIAGPEAAIEEKIDNCLEAIEDEMQSESQGSGPPRARRSSQATGPIESREDALRMMGLVAEYYRVNEPHSPLSFAASQLVRWGKMSLPDLLVEAIPDDRAREHFFMLMGIHPQDVRGGRDD